MALLQELTSEGHDRRPGDARARHRRLRRARGPDQGRPHRQRRTARACPPRFVPGGAEVRGLKPWRDAAGGGARAAAQQAALVPDHARDHHRRRRGDRHGRHRRGRARRRSSRPSRPWARTCSSSRPARSTSGGARGGFGIAADADLGRPRGHRRPRCRRCAAPRPALRAQRAGRSATTRTGRPRQRHDAGLSSRSATGRCARGRPLTRADVDGGRQGGGARPDRGGQALRRQRAIRRPDRPDQERPLRGGRRARAEGAVAQRARLRRRRLRPGDDLPARRSRAACRTTSPARSSSRRHLATTHDAGRRRGSRSSCATGTTSRRAPTTTSRSAT